MLAINTQSAAYASGQLVGLLFGLALLFAGIGKCVAIMRRPTTSSLCVLSLMLILMAWAAGHGWDYAMQRAFVPPAFHWGILLLNVPLVIAAVVLAIVGLSLYDAQQFNQGRKQAVWALVLGTLSLVGYAGTLLQEPLAALATRVAEEAATKNPAEEVVMDDWNFALRPPDSSWTRRADAEMPAATCLGFIRKSDNFFASVIAEQSVSLQTSGLSLVVTKVKANLAAKMTVREQSEASLEMAGVPCIRISTLAYDEGTKTEISYQQWVLLNRGFAWQVTVWGDADKKAAVVAAGETVIKGFRILDARRKSVSADAVVDVERPEEGYTVRLADLGWDRWNTAANKENELPALTTFGAQTMSTALVVMPCPAALPGHTPSLEAMARACLADYDFGYVRSQAAFTTRTVDKPFPGLEIITEREAENGSQFRYLFRIYQGAKQAWMVGGWCSKGVAGSFEKMRAALERVELMEPTESPAAAPVVLRRKEATARWLNQVGLWYHEKGDSVGALRYFREASRLVPDEKTYFENITHSLEQGGKFGEALAIMEMAGARSFAGDHGHLLRRATLMLKAGRAADGLAQVLALVKDGFKNHDAVLAFINELLNLDKEAEAGKLADAYVAAQPEPRPRLWQAQVADRTGDADKATALMEKLLTDEPDFNDASYSLGELSNRQGRYERALEMAEALEKNGQDTVRMHLMRGWAHMGKKWYKDAKASFEKAALLDPKDEDVKTALQDASASLGQGSNTEIKQPIAPVPLPGHIASRLDDLRDLPENFGEGHHAAILLWARCIHYTPTSAMRTTTRRVIRILNDEGADSYSSMEYSYDPVIERIYVNRADVMDTTGKVVASAGLDDVYVLDSGDRSMATTDRTVHIQVPGLKPGYTLDCEITVERHAPRKIFPLMRHLFADSMPTRMEVISITGDVGSISEQRVNGDRIRVTRDKDARVYEVADAPLTSDEPYQDAVEKWAPMVVLAGKDKTWEDLGRDYLKEIATLLKPDSAVEAEARELVKDEKTLQGKVRVLSAHVQKSVRYKAIEFGVRGQIPNAPSLTLQQRYGDCKDQALLLHHLLRACGVPSHLALINTRWDVELQQPTLDAFNHAIVHVPGLEKTLFVDTTASHLAVADHTPYGLWGLPVFVLDPDQPRLMKVPSPLPGSGDVHSKRQISLVAPDGLRITEELTLQGYYASGMRGGFVRTEPKGRFKYAQDLLNDRGNYRLEEFEFVNLTDASQPAILRMTYTLPNAVEKRSETSKLKIPDAWETDYLHLPFIKNRQTDFAWKVPFHFISDVSWDESLPLQPDSVAGLNREVRSEHGEWAMKTSGNRKLHFEFQVKAGQQEAASYTAFQSLWAGARDLWRKEVTLEMP